MTEQANKMIMNSEFNDDGYNRMAQEFIKTMRTKTEVNVIYKESIWLTQNIASEEREKFEAEYEVLITVYSKCVAISKNYTHTEFQFRKK